ncbi:MAG TPA: class II glutamine amidotransferase, partial [Bacteroidales bacterium]|nr:class II glutamine amidotransferase [Bacteroidales bacterium]
MCGIVGYYGYRDAYPILIKGLKRLEYRGYDSAGIALLNSKTRIYKCKGKVSDLEDVVANQDISGHIGMGHTRWATHGEPNDVNAHPHLSMNKLFVVIHNGIIENYNTLRSELENEGYVFISETDTEVLANLIEYVYNTHSVKPEEAVRLALTKVIGAYGILVAHTQEADQIIAARKGSPLVIGKGEREYFFASDATPIIEYTNSVIYLNDDDIAIVNKTGLHLKNISNITKKPEIQKIELEIADIEKSGFEHYMLKEIFEQPRSVTDTCRGRLNYYDRSLKLGGLHAVSKKLIEADRVIIVA